MVRKKRKNESKPYCIIIKKQEENEIEMGRAYDISNDLYMALQAQIGDEGELTNHVIHIIQSECTPYRDYDLNELIFHVDYYQRFEIARKIIDTHDFENLYSVKEPRLHETVTNDDLPF